MCIACFTAGAGVMLVCIAQLHCWGGGHHGNTTSPASEQPADMRTSTHTHLPIARKMSLTFIAVFADVSINSKLFSSA